MAYPTTLALITALWSGAGADPVDRALVGARRRDRRARAADRRRAARALRLGLGLPGHPAARGVALVLAWRSSPAHVNETTEPVDNLGGILSVVLVGAAGPGDQLRAGARQGDAGDRPRRRRVARRRRLRHPPAARRQPALRPRLAARRDFWVAALRRDHRLRLADGRDVRRPAVPPERARLLDPDAGLAILPAAVGMVLVAPRSAKLVEARGARFTLLVGYVFCLLGFLTMLLLWKEGIAYWQVGLGYALVGIGVGFAGTPASHSLTGSVPVKRAGMASGTADLQRDLGGAIMQSIFGALLTAGYAAAVSAAIAVLAGTRARSPSSVQSELTKSFSSAADLAEQYPQYARPDHRRRQDLVPRQGDELAYTAGIVAIAARRGARLLPLPEAATRSRRCSSSTTPKMPEAQSVAARRHPARRRAGHPARALLRPRLRARLHPVHGADVGQPDLVGARPGPARARHALVGLGRLLLADQRHRPRGGRGAAGHVRRDGGAADRLALRARRVRRPRHRLRARLRGGADRPDRALHARQPRRRRPPPLGARARRQHPDRGQPALHLHPLRRRSPRARSGCSPSPSTWAAPTCSAPRAGN